MLIKLLLFLVPPSVYGDGRSENPLYPLQVGTMMAGKMKNNDQYFRYSEQCNNRFLRIISAQEAGHLGQGGAGAPLPVEEVCVVKCGSARG